MRKVLSWSTVVAAAVAVIWYPLGLGSIAVVQERAPSSDQGPAVALPAARESSPIAAAPEARYSPPRSSANVDTWRAFDQSYDKTLRLLRHQAALSGKLVDIAAATALVSRCASNPMPPEHYERAGLNLPERQKQLLTDLLAQCEEGALTVHAVVKDLSGYTGDPAALRQAAGGSRVFEPADQDKILAFAKGVRSPSLLEAVAPAVIDAKSLARMGLPPQAGFPEALDREMAIHAIRVRACEARGDCRGAAALATSCAVVNACVDDLREYGPKRLFGRRSDRATFPGLIGDQAPSPEAVGARWDQIQATLQANVF